MNSIHKSKSTTLNLFSNKLDLSHLDKLDLNIVYFQKKHFALVNIINNKEDLVKLDPFIDDYKSGLMKIHQKGSKFQKVRQIVILIYNNIVPLIITL